MRDIVHVNFPSFAAIHSLFTIINIRIVETRQQTRSRSKLFLKCAQSELFLMYIVQEMYYLRDEVYYYSRSVNCKNLSISNFLSFRWKYTRNKDSYDRIIRRRDINYKYIGWKYSVNICRKAKRKLSSVTRDGRQSIKFGGGVSRDASGISTLILITRYTMYWFIVIMPPYVYHVGYMPAPPPHPCLSTLFNPWDMIMLTRAEENFPPSYIYTACRRREQLLNPDCSLSREMEIA